MHGHFDVLKFSPYGHTSILFFPLMGIPELIFPGKYLAFSIWQTILSSISILSFYCLVGECNNNQLSRNEKALWAAIFGFWPAILANMINFSLDQGVVIFFVPYWFSLLRGCNLSTTICGLLMVFSKASGIFLFPLPWLAALLVQRKGHRWHWVKQRISVATLIIGAILFYMYCKIQVQGTNGLYQIGPSMVGWWPLLKGSPTQEVTVAAQLFLLSFSWCIGIMIVLGLYKVSLNGVGGKFLLSSLFILGLIFFLLTRYLPFTNVRYVMVCYVIWIIAGSQATLLFLKNQVTRYSCLCCILVLVFLSNFRTFDPLSGLAFGTFKFGQHKMLQMTSITHECCGLYGRDQLVYNLEIMRSLSALDLFFRDVKPKPPAMLIFPSGSTFATGPNNYGQHLLMGSINKDTYRRTTDESDTFNPMYIEANEIQQNLPSTVYYVSFPLFEYEPLDGLFKWKCYFVQNTKQYAYDGYIFDVRKFQNHTAKCQL